MTCPLLETKINLNGSSSSSIELSVNVLIYEVLLMPNKEAPITTLSEETLLTLVKAKN